MLPVVKLVVECVFSSFRPGKVSAPGKPGALHSGAGDQHSLVQCCHSNILVKAVALYFATWVGLRQVAAGIPPGIVHSLSYIIESSGSLQSS